LLYHSNTRFLYEKGDRQKRCPGGALGDFVKRFLSLVPTLLFCGCIHTQVTREEVTPSEGAYKQILVCSLSKDPARAELTEALVSSSLKKHRVKTSTCHEFLNRQDSPEQQKKNIQDAGYQAVFIFERMASPERTGPIPVDAVLEKRESSDTHALPVEASTVTNSIDGFLSLYALPRNPLTPESDPSSTDRQNGLVGKKRSITGVIKLVDVMRNQVSWLGGGTVEGPSSESLKNLLKAVSQRAMTELANAGLISP
jgi:hypothetical protein